MSQYDAATALFRCFLNPIFLLLVSTRWMQRTRQTDRERPPWSVSAADAEPKPIRHGPSAVSRETLSAMSLLLSQRRAISSIQGRNPSGAHRDSCFSLSLNVFISRSHQRHLDVIGKSVNVICKTSEKQAAKMSPTWAGKRSPLYSTQQRLLLHGAWSCVGCQIHCHCMCSYSQKCATA